MTISQRRRIAVLCAAVITIALSALAQAGPGTAFTYQARVNDGVTPVTDTVSLEYTLHTLAVGGTQLGPTITPPDRFITDGLVVEELDFGPVFTGDPVFLQLRVDVGGGADSYQALGSRTELLPVPYSMYSEIAGSSLNDAVNDADADPANELQNLSSTTSGTNRTLNITGGTGTTISVADNDNSASNELQTLSKSGGTISLSGGGGSVTDAVNDADANPSNEIQNLSSATSGTNRTLNITGGTGTTISVADNDNNASNELQTLSFSSPTLSISSGNSVDLSALSGGGAGDGHSLNAADGTPIDALFVENDGLTGIGTTSPAQELELAVVTGSEAAMTFSASKPAPNTFAEQLPGTGFDAGGGQPWTNPGNITADDNADATITTTGSANSGLLTASNYGFAVPPGATIVGVQVFYERELSDPAPFPPGGSIEGLKVSLTTPGSSQFIDTDVSGRSINVFGNATFLWGVALTPAIVNSAGFGVTFQVDNNGSGDATAEIDYARVRVFYNPNATIPVNYTLGVEDGTVGRMHLSTGTDLSSPLVTVTDTGRVGINEPSPIFPLEVGTNATNGNGAHVTNGGTWTNGSSREWKTNFRQLDPLETLERLTVLPMTYWEYSGSDEGTHLGPTAEDFRAAFGLGHSDQYIATVDADGVALSAIQGLNQKLEEEKAALRAKNRELERRLERLESLLVE